MTRRQVRFVLGTPIIEDTFNADRWDYVHVVRLGNENLSRSQLTVVFEGDVWLMSKVILSAKTGQKRRRDRRF